VPSDILTITCAIQRQEPCVRKQIEEIFKIVWKPGIFAYCYISGIQYVLPEEEKDLPDKYQHLKGLVEPVRIRYVDDEKGKNTEGLIK
jgi:hypothetical protein